jgi:hypothetical protein
VSRNVRQRSDRPARALKQLHATFPSLINHATVEAFSNKTDALVYTVHLPSVTRSWLRKLLHLSPRAAVHGGMWPLDANQLSKIQRLTEISLDARVFAYFLDGDSTVQMKTKQ